MAHYFDNEPTKDAPVQYQFELAGHRFDLTSNAGVFSTRKLDTGSRILLECVLKNQAPVKSVVDLGCGIGVIGVVLAILWDARITAIDVNQKACELARENLEKIHADFEVWCQDGIQKGSYPLILLNPPIRAGKQVIYHLFDQSYEHLEAGGSLWIVIRKQHGAQSAMKHLENLGFITRRVDRDKGFWVIEAKKPES